MTDADFWTQETVRGRFNFSVASGIREAVRRFNSAFRPAFDRTEKGYCVVKKIGSNAYQPVLYGGHRAEELVHLLNRKMGDMSDLGGFFRRKKEREAEARTKKFDKAQEGFVKAMGDKLTTNGGLRETLIKRVRPGYDAIKLDGSGPNRGGKHFGKAFSR